jgi:hypothetical protein
MPKTYLPNMTVGAVLNNTVMNRIADKAIAKKAVKPTPAEYAALVKKAHEAGIDAGFAAYPTKMVVTDEVRGKTWLVDEGACGFAWINFKGNTAFGRWAKKAGVARPAYNGGLQVWVSEFGQSVDRKAAYAGAYAKVLKEAGIEAYAGDRLD